VTALEGGDGEKGDFEGDARPFVVGELEGPASLEGDCEVIGEVDDIPFCCGWEECAASPVNSVEVVCRDGGRGGDEVGRIDGLGLLGSAVGLSAVSSDVSGVVRLFAATDDDSEAVVVTAFVTGFSISSTLDISASILDRPTLSSSALSACSGAVDNSDNGVDCLDNLSSSSSFFATSSSSSSSRAASTLSGGGSFEALDRSWDCTI
jgi:hypothetical protein